jgi:hypothetical protein
MGSREVDWAILLLAEADLCAPSGGVGKASEHLLVSGCVEKMSPDPEGPHQVSA